jgi:NAD(P)-dependent dehydrogenase (short-subunit alcohol dehydrogenase family)
LEGKLRHLADPHLAADHRPQGRRRDARALEAHARLLDEKYADRESLVLTCDVTEEDEVRSMVTDAVAGFGWLDILVNTAGGTGPIETPAQDYPVDEFRSILELNVLGTFLPCKHAIPHLIARGGGRIESHYRTCSRRTKSITIWPATCYSLMP